MVGGRQWRHFFVSLVFSHAVRYIPIFNQLSVKSNFEKEKIPNRNVNDPATTPTTPTTHRNNVAPFEKFISFFLISPQHLMTSQSHTHVVYSFK